MERKINITKSKALTFRCCIHICYGLGLWYISLIIKCCGWLGWLYICISGRCSYVLGGLIARNLVNTQTGMRTNQKYNNKTKFLFVKTFEFGIIQAKINNLNKNFNNIKLKRRRDLCCSLCGIIGLSCSVCSCCWCLLVIRFGCIVRLSCTTITIIICYRRYRSSTYKLICHIKW